MGYFISLFALSGQAPLTIGYKCYSVIAIGIVMNPGILSE